MRVQILPPAPYADVSIMVLPRIANPFIPFEGCAGSSPVVRAKWRDSIRGQYNGLVNRWCGIMVHSRLHLPPQYKGKYKALVMLRSQFDSVWWLQSLADETCRVPEREMWHLGILQRIKRGISTLKMARQFRGKNTPLVWERSRFRHSHEPPFGVFV